MESMSVITRKKGRRIQRIDEKSVHRCEEVINPMKLKKKILK